MYIPAVVNTSNHKKQEEFIRLFEHYNFPVTFFAKDVQEIVGTPLEVIVHKASVIGENVIVEDTSLDLEGYKVGIRVKQLLDIVTKPERVGTKAIWKSLMAFVQCDKVYVFEGEVNGIIVPKAGYLEFGFAQYFLPEGATKTLGQERNDLCNARARCLKNMMEQKIAHVMPVMGSFDGYELQDK
jgi:XTP/dITP diphosphohydrolase